ncbi:hypothetical protein RIF29_35511 [Crotalaria pallida]|uniref:Uncharacterized protein n=1 Tax=Crotalaria pallida TaxID=3830 RepID=A0AAN9EAD4_CROPI
MRTHAPHQGSDDVSALLNHIIFVILCCYAFLPIDERVSAPARFHVQAKLALSFLFFFLFISSSSASVLETLKRDEPEEEILLLWLWEWTLVRRGWVVVFFFQESEYE